MAVEPELISIPDGLFWMGTSEGEIQMLAEMDETARKWAEKGHFSREQPQHQLHLPAYQIGKFPVTVGEYRGFVAARGYERRVFWTAAGWTWREIAGRTAPDFWDDPEWVGETTQPVVGVTWYEAAAYCRWLAGWSGKPYRLPTEAEWEKVARGMDRRLFPWGDVISAEAANTRLSEINCTLPVGVFSSQDVSPYGCVEMGGNVSEWVLSAFEPYPYYPHDGREDPEKEVLRVIRGGAWFKPILRARTAARGMNDPDFSDDDVGFRVACG